MRSLFSVSEVFKDEFVLCVHANSLNHGQLFATPRTVAHQAPVSVGFSRQEYWRGLPCPPSGDRHYPRVEPTSLCLLHWQEDSLSLMAQTVKNLPAMQRLGFNPSVRKIPWRGGNYPLQYSCLENPMDRGAWPATVHGVAKSRTRLSD